jgi:uncharacterized protein
VEITYDAAKNKENIATRGLSFDRAIDFDFNGAVYVPDHRRKYRELRIRAFGLLDGRLHVLVFTEIRQGIRVISLRRANKREVRDYG